MNYVMSDIHGHKKRFESILSQINLQPEDRLYILGDVIDRNPEGLSILYRLMGMPNVTMLPGNHERMMLDVLANPSDPYLREMWYRNGGRVTHYQWRGIPTSLRQKMIRYLNRLPVNVDLRIGDKDYLLVHGAPEVCWSEDPEYYDNSATYAVWKRLEPDKKYVDGKTIIFGHTPTMYYQDGSPARIWYGDGMIGIDCGAAYPSGRLACLRLEDGKVFYAD